MPARIRVALALALTILIAPTVIDGSAPQKFDNLASVFAITKELFVGNFVWVYFSDLLLSPVFHWRHYGY